MLQFTTLQLFENMLRSEDIDAGIPGALDLETPAEATVCGEAAQALNHGLFTNSKP